MRWRLLALAAMAGLVAAAGLLSRGESDSERERTHPAATVFHEQRVGPRIVDLNIRSPALGTTAMVRLLTPDGWAQRASARWPVLYLLHGCCDSYESWTRSTGIETWPQLRDILVVMPEAGAVGFYSDWRRGPGWETFHLGELRRLLERDYGAGSRRAVAGLSMGGLGALSYPARHPDLFRAAASFSGVLHPLQDSGFMLGLFSGYTPDPRAIWGDPVRNRATWAGHDPTALAGKLPRIPLFVSAGNGRPGPLDEGGQGVDPIEARVMWESRAFVRRLRELDVPVRAEFYGAGTHAWPYWERELRHALPLLLAPLSRRTA
jgi:diacylglycerol O-acyltransferase / trehalose O-mycolyltransferase